MDGGIAYPAAITALSHGQRVGLVPEISVENELAGGELVSVSVKELACPEAALVIGKKPACRTLAAFLQVAEALATERQDVYRF